MQRRKRPNYTHRTQYKHLRTMDYPTSITRHLNYKKSWKLHRPCNTCFLKLPHFSEIIIKWICRAIYKEGLDIQMTHSGPSLCQYPTKKNDNTITTCILANCPIRHPNICLKTYTIYRLIYFKRHNFYVESTIRFFHMRIKKTQHTLILIL